ncbi:hypothetical protein CIW52_11265 [Mycolicibacterium sp. P9-64]|uniref:hypothetical protein n=1 Tax=Mycolicibacterium sp. P9-64 TaxID=2024612 RepID=UPI0011EFD34D|nr:hypothetical protein [Mycolicibacterium sp. P9-64]KAA0084570.1 hypothetical protein CIW52_11265 [Mycolicibacterium sp. P9-64]
MHTARQLVAREFAVTMGGSTASREDLLPDWGPLDRLGVVVHEPFGAIGASHLIQLAITAYYDIRPNRRDGFPSPGNYMDPRAVYPEIYLFHVGGRWGNHSDFDFWPARKEVFLPNDPRRVLDAINDRAITRLAVPDGATTRVEHEFKEPAAAIDRMTNAWAYSPSGRVAHGNISICGLSRRTEVNVKSTLNPARGSIRAAAQPESFDEDEDLRQRSYAHRRIIRADESSEGLEAARAARESIRTDGKATETYRSMAIGDALACLAPSR